MKLGVEWLRSGPEDLEVKAHETGGGERLRSGPKEFLTLKLDHTQPPASRRGSCLSIPTSTGGSRGFCSW